MYGKEEIGSKEGQKGLPERKSNEPCSFVPSATSQWNDVIPNMKRLKDGFERLGLGVPVKPYSRCSRWRGGLDGTQSSMKDCCSFEHPSLVTGKFGCGET
jgi:hypothetical protein